MLYLAFGVLLFSTSIYAFLGGGWEGRCISLLLFSAAAIGPVMIPVGVPQFSKALLLLVLDGSLLAGLLVVVLLSDRFWPLWLAGLHLLAVAAEVVTLIDSALLEGAYEAAQSFWSIPMQVLLTVGVQLDRRAAGAKSGVCDREVAGPAEARGPDA